MITRRTKDTSSVSLTTPVVKRWIACLCVRCITCNNLCVRIFIFTRCSCVISHSERWTNVKRRYTNILSRYFHTSGESLTWTTWENISFVPVMTRRRETSFTCNVSRSKRGDYSLTKLENNLHTCACTFWKHGRKLRLWTCPTESEIFLIKCQLLTLREKLWRFRLKGITILEN